jgi:hypothetical protein
MKIRKSSTGAERSQSERFKEAARALGCDEDEAAFDAKLKVLAKQKPKDEPKPTEAQKKD